MYVSEFNAMYGFFILSSAYDWAFKFLSTIGTGTVLIGIKLMVAVYMLYKN